MRTQGNKQLTLDQAYQAAYLWLDHIGDPPLEISEPAHGAVELVTEDAFIRVRSSDSPVEQSSVLALLRAAHAGKRLVMFSPSGFSTGAKSIAETQGIALYTLDTRGRALPETTHARSNAPETEPEPPFTPAASPTDDDYWSGFRANQPSASESQVHSTDAGIQAGAGDWADCPNCGVTHYRNANFCRECGTDLTDHQHSLAEAGDSATPPASGVGTGIQHDTDTGLRCRTCGSHDIELIE